MGSKKTRLQPYEIFAPNSGTHVKVSVDDKEIILDSANYENPELESKKNLVFNIRIGNHNIGNGNYCVATKDSFKNNREEWIYNDDNWRKFDGVPSELFYMIVNETTKRQNQKNNSISNDKKEEKPKFIVTQADINELNKHFGSLSIKSHYR